AWLACITACGRTPDVPVDAGLPAGDAIADSGTGALAIEPPAIHVPAGRNQIFVANNAVTWSVMEVGGGAIDTTGMYVAPNVPGTYHVMATDGTNVGVATVIVEQMVLTLVTGAMGGQGIVDGIHDEARFVQPHGTAYDGAGTLFVGDSK